MEPKKNGDLDPPKTLKKTSNKSDVPKSNKNFPDVEPASLPKVTALSKKKDPKTENTLKRSKKHNDCNVTKKKVKEANEDGAMEELQPKKFDNLMPVGPTYKLQTILLDDGKINKEAAIKALENEAFLQLDRKAIIAELLPHFEEVFTVDIIFDTILSFYRSEDPATWKCLLLGTSEGKHELNKFARMYNLKNGRTNYTGTTPSKVALAFTTKFKKTEVREIVSSLFVKLLDARRRPTTSRLSFEKIKGVLGEEVHTNYMNHIKDSVLKHLWCEDITLDGEMRIGFHFALNSDEIRLVGEESEIKKLAISCFSRKNANAIRMKVLLGNRSKQKNIISKTESLLEEQKVLADKIEHEYQSLAKERELESLMEAAMKNIELIFENDISLVNSFFRFLEDFKSLDNSCDQYEMVLNEIDSELYVKV